MTCYNIVLFVSAMTEEQEEEYFKELKAQNLIDDDLENIIRANAKVARLNEDATRVNALFGVANVLKYKNPDVWEQMQTKSAPGYNQSCCAY